MTNKSEDELIGNGAEAYVRYLVAAEKAVACGQFNLAKVLRALAYSHRAVAMSVVAAEEVDPVEELLEMTDRQLETAPAMARGVDAAILQTASARAVNLSRRSIAALQSEPDVPESVVPLNIYVCINCGNIAEAGKPEFCDLCGALSTEFETMGPYFASDSEHLGQLTPQAVIQLLAAAPDELDALLDGVGDALLTRKPSQTEWSIKEIVGHLIEVDALFMARIDAILTRSPLSQPRPPWLLHEGKGYQALSPAALLERFRTVRGQAVARAAALTSDEWSASAHLLGGSRTVLATGTWAANHSVGHIAQVRRLLPPSAAVGRIVGIESVAARRLRRRSHAHINRSARQLH